MMNNKEITLRLVKAQKDRPDPCYGCYFHGIKDCYIQSHSGIFDCGFGNIWIEVKTDKGNISDDIKQKIIDS